MTHLYLVRHGENPANLTHEFSCRKVDYSLTDKGRLQALQTAQFLANVAFDGLWTSPLKRAHETALEIAKSQRAQLQVVEDLREMNVGSLEGQEPQHEAWAHYAQIMKQWLSGKGEVAFPFGENRRELCDRLRRTLLSLTEGRQDETHLVVGHGGLFTHGVAELCGIEDQRAFFGLENHNCSISRVDLVREGSETRFVLAEWASVAHLSGEASRVVESVPEQYRVRNL